MAIYYIDLVLGNDANPGTAGSPLLTINAAHAKASGPHDIRVAKTTAATTEGAATTLGWTQNSATVTTSTDLSAVFTAGTLIGKPTAAGNGATETFYRVASSTAASITLSHKYQGSTGNTTGCLKQTYVTTGAGGADACTITTAGTTISGGWNLSGTPTQDGETWAKTNNARTVVVAMFRYSANVTISKFNTAETHYATNVSSGTARATVSNCSFINYSRPCIVQTSGGALDLTNCVLNSETAETVYYNAGYTNTASHVNCLFYNGTAGYRIGTASAGQYTFTNCVFAGATSQNMYNVAYPCILDFTGCTIRHSAAGFSNSVSATKIIGGTYQNCTTGIANTYRVGLWVTDATFTDCTTGIGSAPFGMRVENCTFSGGNNHIYMEQYAHDVELLNCTFTSPVVHAVYKETGAGSCIINNCTTNSLTPLRDSGEYGRLLPDYYVKNSFSYLDGVFFPWYYAVKDTGTYRVTPPSMQVTFTTSAPGNYTGPIKVASSYFPESAVGVEGRDVSVYLKCNATWSGTITPILKLNGRTISTESNITSLTTSWVQYTYSFAMGDLDEDGELTLEFIITANTVSMFFDDVEWTVT